MKSITLCSEVRGQKVTLWCSVLYLQVWRPAYAHLKLCSGGMSCHRSFTRTYTRLTSRLLIYIYTPLTYLQYLSFHCILLWKDWRCDQFCVVIRESPLICCRMVHPVAHFWVSALRACSHGHQQTRSWSSADDFIDKNSILLLITLDACVIYRYRPVL